MVSIMPGKPCLVKQRAANSLKPNQLTLVARTVRLAISTIRLPFGAVRPHPFFNNLALPYTKASQGV